MAPAPRLIDRLLRRKPPTLPVGDSGRAHTSGFPELEELNAQLQGREGLRIFDKMYRTDPDVRRSVRMGINPVLAGTWTVEAYGGETATPADQQVAKDVEWALGIGPDPGPVRPAWAGHLDEALPLLVRSGFLPAEITWAPADRDGRTLLAPSLIGIRLPRSIYRWNDDGHGELLSVEQLSPRQGSVTLPREDLLYYRVGAEGDNWEGESLLRPVYKPWLFKDKIERLDAIAQEREAVGLPVVYPPRNPDPDVLSDLEDKLANLRAGELAYLIMPGPAAEDLGDDADQGWRFSIEGLGGGGEGGRDPQPSLEYHRDAIAAAFISEFMRLGQSGEGARAVGDVQVDPFEKACEVLAGIIKREATERLIARFVALNYPPGTKAPTLAMSLAEGDLAALSAYTGQLVAAGLVHADDDLEDFLRERGNLPPADPAARADRKAQEEADAARAQESHDKAMKAPDTPPAPPPGGKRQLHDHPCPAGVEGCDGSCQEH